MSDLSKEQNCTQRIFDLNEERDDSSEEWAKGLQIIEDHNSNLSHKSDDEHSLFASSSHIPSSTLTNNDRKNVHAKKRQDYPICPQNVPLTTTPSNVEEIDSKGNVQNTQYHHPSSCSNINYCEGYVPTVNGIIRVMYPTNSQGSVPPPDHNTLPFPTHMTSNPLPHHIPSHPHNTSIPPVTMKHLMQRLMQHHPFPATAGSALSVPFHKTFPSTTSLTAVGTSGTTTPGDNTTTSITPLSPITPSTASPVTMQPVAPATTLCTNNDNTTRPPPQKMMTTATTRLGQVLEGMEESDSETSTSSLSDDDREVRKLHQRSMRKVLGRDDNALPQEKMATRQLGEDEGQEQEQGEEESGYAMVDEAMLMNAATSTGVPGTGPGIGTDTIGRNAPCWQQPPIPRPPALQHPQYTTTAAAASYTTCTLPPAAQPYPLPSHYYHPHPTATMYYHPSPPYYLSTMHPMMQQGPSLQPLPSALAHYPLFTRPPLQTNPIHHTQDHNKAMINPNTANTSSKPSYAIFPLLPATNTSTNTNMSANGSNGGSTSTNAAVNASTLMQLPWHSLQSRSQFQPHPVPPSQSSSTTSTPTATPRLTPKVVAAPTSSVAVTQQATTSTAKEERKEAANKIRRQKKRTLSEAYADDNGDDDGEDGDVEEEKGEDPDGDEDYLDDEDGKNEENIASLPPRRSNINTKTTKPTTTVLAMTRPNQTFYLPGNRKKATEQARNILMDWLVAHQQHPYPNKRQREDLAALTGMTVKQIVHWMSNMRKRRLVPLLVGQKPPSSAVEVKFLEEVEKRQNQLIRQAGSSYSVSDEQHQFGNSGGLEGPLTSHSSYDSFHSSSQLIVDECTTSSASSILPVSAPPTTMTLPEDYILDSSAYCDGLEMNLLSPLLSPLPLPNHRTTNCHTSPSISQPSPLNNFSPSQFFDSIAFDLSTTNPQYPFTSS